MSDQSRASHVPVYGPYSVRYTGVRPCPYRVLREGVEVFSCALASQVSAYVGKQDDGYHLTDAEMASLLGLQFTPEDIKHLHWAADLRDKVGVRDGGWTATALRSLADRIESLLPPEAP